MPQCKLPNCLAMLNNYEEEFKAIFRQIKRLDLTGCQLGDEHELLPYLGTSCPHLESLVLAANCLSSKGLRLSFGVPTSGNFRFPSLLSLDLRQNPSITIGGVKRYVIEVMKDKVLHVLHVSAVSYSQIPEQGKCFQPSFQRVVVDCLVPEQLIENKGWACPMVEGWHARMREKLKMNQIKKARTRFYAARLSGTIAHKKNADISECSKEISVCYEKSSAASHVTPYSRPRCVLSPSNEAAILQKKFFFYCFRF
ncbi:MAG TPA: hypothetical protein EYQ86_08560 [Bacteroidetes bacterium]|nr:hypothetical protein [Bacteroidota bacterium]